jgi:DNA-binding NarL/FixJ family response regulator
VKRTAVVLDPHPLWLDAVEGVLERLDVEVAGKTGSFAEAAELLRAHRPDVLLLETQDGPENGSGYDVIRDAYAAIPDIKVIVLSHAQGTSDVDAAFDAGAVAYVFKSAHPDDLASAVRQAFDTSIFLASRHRPSAAAADVAPARRYDEAEPSLTKRELEILQLVSEGHSNGELARMLWVTEQTVKFHLSNIYRKLDVANRTEASRWAQLHGLLASAIGATAA